MPSVTSLVAQTVKRLPTMRETQVQSLGWEDPLEREMATHSSTLGWKIPWMEEHGRLQSMGSQRVGHDWATSLKGCQALGWVLSYTDDWDTGSVLPCIERLPAQDIAFQNGRLIHTVQKLNRKKQTAEFLFLSIVTRANWSMIATDTKSRKRVHTHTHTHSLSVCLSFQYGKPKSSG